MVARLSSDQRSQSLHLRKKPPLQHRYTNIDLFLGEWNCARDNVGELNQTNWTSILVMLWLWREPTELCWPRECFPSEDPLPDLPLQWVEPLKGTAVTTPPSILHPHSSFYVSNNALAGKNAESNCNRQKLQKPCRKVPPSPLPFLASPLTVKPLITV